MSGARETVGAVTDDGMSVRQAPRKRAAAEVKDFSTMVRVPGRPGAARVFTDAERSQAEAYAADTGGSVLPLPLSPPPELRVPNGTKRDHTDVVNNVHRRADEGCKAVRDVWRG
jgi:hypothetical protein